MYEQLPIPKISAEEHYLIEQLVQSALDAKKEDPDSDISVIEEKINLHIYLAYKFEHKDILKIDPDFNLTDAEYSALANK